MLFEIPNQEQELKSKIEIEENYQDFIPEDFLNNPVEYFEREGINIKQGEIKKDETGKVREDPTAVKDMPVWINHKNEELYTIGKRVNIEKGKIKESGDPFYEFNIMKKIKEKNLPVATPIAKIEDKGIYLIIVEKIHGIRWSEKDALKLREKGYTNEDIEDLKSQAEKQMNELKDKFEQAGIKRGWKLKDMVFEIDFDNKKILNMIPTDWERTKVVD